ncbi:helix-turn-helix domain-containing protein [Streptomyces cinereoruber]|uniref:helix-turn-helix domain-containing protein n=1 Tax=Streptomyces cinereoruber TaxID=67260 RepID=UPI003631AB0B
MLLNIRKQHGWSLNELELRTGVSRATLNRMERGLTEPSTSDLFRVCSAYGCRASRFLAEVEQRFLDSLGPVPDPPPSPSEGELNP